MERVRLPLTKIMYLPNFNFSAQFDGEIGKGVHKFFSNVLLLVGPLPFFEVLVSLSISLLLKNFSNEFCRLEAPKYFQSLVIFRSDYFFSSNFKNGVWKQPKRCTIFVFCEVNDRRCNSICLGREKGRLKNVQNLKF